MDFRDKSIIVTGGAQGIGKSCVSLFLELGSKVCIADVDENVGKRTEEELSKKYKDKVFFEKCDVTDYGSFEGVVRKTVSIFGKLDILMNNAGIVNEANWMQTIKVNFVGVVHGIRLALEYMSKDKGKDGGRVINTASLAGLRPYYVTPVYSATKSAVTTLTRCYGSDYYEAKHGVTVNAICPCAVDTELIRSGMEIKKEFHPMPEMKLISPDIVAKAVEKLLRDGRNGVLLRMETDGTFNYTDEEERADTF